MGGCSFSIFYYELSIEGINKDTAKWFIKMMACAYIYVTIGQILNFSEFVTSPDGEHTKSTTKPSQGRKIDEV